MIQLPRYGPHFRWFTVLYAIGLLVWFSLEDDSPLAIILWGLGAAVLMVVWWGQRQTSIVTIQRAYLPLVASALGLMLGLLTSVCTVGLMFFKDALHAHVFPDYPPGLMLAILGQAPAWALSGLLLGLGGALLYLAVQPDTQAKPYDQ